MRFRFQATVKPGYDLEKIDVTFSAPTWGDASEWSLIFVRQVGLKASDLDAGYSITYADPADKPTEPSGVVIIK